MNTDLDALFPDDLSDEAAAALADVLFSLALACENHYFTRLRRFHASQQEPVDPDRPWQRATKKPGT